MRGILVAILAFQWIAIPAARAGGYLLGEESATATGMVGAFAAKADDASAIFYNPAGLARLRGWQAYAGGMLLVGRPTASPSAALALPNGEVHGNTFVQFVPNVYLAYGLPHDVSVGVGLFTNVGLKVTWPTDWEGRFISTWAAVQTLTVNPSVAWSPVPWFSIGAGFDVTPGRAELKRFENLVNGEALLRFRGNDTAFGGNVGVLFRTDSLWRDAPPISLAVTYRSRYTFHFDDGAVQINAPLEFSTQLHDVKARASLPVPDLVTAAVGVRPVDELFLQLQFDWQDWSRFKTLALNVPENPALNLTIPQDWKDGYVLRFGAEYSQCEWAVRAGIGFDWAPVPKATLGPVIPDTNRLLLSVGGSLNLPDRFALDLGVMGVVLFSRQSRLPEFPVEYNSWAVLVSLGLRYQSPTK